ncbi:DUF1622 domain-containing protein [Leifsonia sp. NPDC058292]|uniref:DUF1622 domain-containing protein n=1 Tax=Leifsonia sp. NPDC058292 TaxID=3346428 RepID=UPI0036DC7E54
MFGHEFFDAVAVAFEVVGVSAMVIGFIVAVGITLRTWAKTRSGATAFRTLRETFGGVILLGLEVLVAADLVKTVTSTPSLTDALVLALIVLIRTVLSFSLQVEIDGVAPWRRALVTGPEVLARAAARSGDGSQPNAG